jgi:hypothetical protein
VVLGLDDASGGRLPAVSDTLEVGREFRNHSRICEGRKLFRCQLLGHNSHFANLVGSCNVSHFSEGESEARSYGQRALRVRSP